MPLGRPVEPEEYIQNAISSRWVSASASSAAKPFSHGVSRKRLRRSVVADRAVDDDQGASAVSLQASASKREQNSASATATVAPESAR